MKTVTLVEKLYSHSFTQAVLTDARAVAARSQETDTSLLDIVSGIDPSEDEYHVLATGFSLVHLLSLLTQLAQIPAYVGEYARTKSMARRKVNRASDIQYHLENFIIRARGLEDRAMQLTAAVLHFGLDLRDVKYQSLRRNAHVLSKDLQPYLKKINALCQQFSEARNQVIHQHGLLDGELRRVELMLHASRTGGELSARAKSLYRRHVGDLGRTKVEEFDEFCRDAVESVAQLFEVLHSVYIEKRRQLTGAA